MGVRFNLCAILVIVTRLLQAEQAASSADVLPVQFHEGLLWVDVEVAECQEPLRFLLDSGASVSVVNLSTARRLGLALGQIVNATAIGTNVSGFFPVRLSAAAGVVPLPGEFLALDLDRLAASCARPVDGLIGADFFRDRITEIDYSERTVRILSSAHVGLDHTVVPLKMGTSGFRVAVRVNGGKRQWVRLDTGCATAFQWVATHAWVGRRPLKLAVGLSELSIPQTLTSIRLGDATVEAVPTGLHRQAFFPGEWGLLGNGLLAGFDVIVIDAKRGGLLLGRGPRPGARRR